MNANDYFRIVSGIVKEALKGAGFKSKGRTFVADHPEVALIVQLQRSTSSTKDLLILTANLGVFSKTVAAKLGYPISTASAWDCHWHERIGSLLPADEDRWWSIANEDEAKAAGQEIAAILVQWGLPVLQGLDSTAKLRLLWESGSSPGLTPVQRKDYLAALSQ